MYTVFYTNKFDKDVKRCVKRGLDIAKLQEATRLLAADVVKRDYKLDIYKLEDQKKMRLAPEQRNAVKVLLSNAVSLLIGGPGCGKTTIEQFIIEVFKMYHPNDNVLLLAPTGKAARRMSESTGYPACTIHKGLGVSAGTEVLETDTILDASLILVDEASMVDTQVGAALFKAVSPLRSLKSILFPDFTTASASAFMTAVLSFPSACGVIADTAHIRPLRVFLYLFSYGDL